MIDVEDADQKLELQVTFRLEYYFLNRTRICWINMMQPRCF